MAIPPEICTPTCGTKEMMQPCPICLQYHLFGAAVSGDPAGDLHPSVRPITAMYTPCDGLSPLALRGDVRTSERQCCPFEGTAVVLVILIVPPARVGEGVCGCVGVRVRAWGGDAAKRPCQCSILAPAQLQASTAAAAQDRRRRPAGASSPTHRTSRRPAGEERPVL